MALSSTPAYAWKPDTHVFFAEQALKDAVDDGKVSIYRTDYENGQRLDKIGDYEVDSELLSALRAYPQQYRAGVIGPDAYPDILTGQQMIHPDESNPDGTNSWLKYLWNNPSIDESNILPEPNSCPDRNRDGIGDSEVTEPNSQAIKAFLIGFLTHAAGDMYGHTFVNNFTGGPFALFPPAGPKNAAKHIALESYISKRIPPIISSDNKVITENDISIDGVDRFIYDRMIYAKPGTQLETNLLVGDGSPLSVPRNFSLLRAELETSKAGSNPLVERYKNAWIKDIDCGLLALPKVSHDLNKALLFNSEKIDPIKAKKILEDYQKHLISMSGAPDTEDWLPDDIKVIKDFINRIVSSIPYVDQVKKLVSESVEVVQEGLFDYLLEEAFEETTEKVIEYVKQPQNHFDELFNSGNSGQKTTLQAFNAQELKLVDTGYSNPNETFDYQKVPAAYNTVTMSKLLLLNQSGMNQLLGDLGSSLSLTEPNAMLGFIRTLDGDNQWHINPQKMIFA